MFNSILRPFGFRVCRLNPFCFFLRNGPHPTDASPKVFYNLNTPKLKRSGVPTMNLMQTMNPMLRQIMIFITYFYIVYVLRNSVCLYGLFVRPTYCSLHGHFITDITCVELQDIKLWISMLWPVCVDKKLFVILRFDRLFLQPPHTKKHPHPKRVDLFLVV